MGIWDKELVILATCKNCEGLYTVDKSLSSLKMTYCTTLCEVKDLGFHLESLEKGLYDTSVFEETHKPISQESTPPPVKEDDDDSKGDLVIV